MKGISILLALVLMPLFLTSAVKITRYPVSTDSLLTGPHIVFDSSKVDLGTIQSGNFAEHTYVLRNAGTAPLRITRVYPSCGCTIALLDDSTILPAHESRIHIKFDSRNKGLGPIYKSIRVESNDPVNPHFVLSFTVSIVPFDTVKEHAAAKAGGMMHLDGVFAGDCAKCHVDKGKGLSGMALWNADCAICHGSPEDHKPGPALTSSALMGHSQVEWMNIVNNGLPKANMPAFSDSKKGPLSTEQIASLTEYLSAVKAQLASAEKQQQSVGLK